jgi:hypothetical protein
MTMTSACDLCVDDCTSLKVLWRDAFGLRERRSFISGSPESGRLHQCYGDEFSLWNDDRM